MLLCFFIVYQLKAFEKHFLAQFANLFINLHIGDAALAAKAVIFSKSGSRAPLRSDIYTAHPAAAAQNMNTCTPPCPISMPSVNSASSSTAQYSASSAALILNTLRMARRTSYKTPSAKPVSTDTASCASWSETSTCIQPKSFCQKPPEGALSS